MPGTGPWHFYFSLLTPSLQSKSISNKKGKCDMKSFKKIISMCLALVLCLSCVPAAFAAEVDDATIDQNRKGSLTIYKYDFTISIASHWLESASTTLCNSTKSVLFPPMPNPPSKSTSLSPERACIPLLSDIASAFCLMS